MVGARSKRGGVRIIGRGKREESSDEEGLSETDRYYTQQQQLSRAPPFAFFFDRGHCTGASLLLSVFLQPSSKWRSDRRVCCCATVIILTPLSTRLDSSNAQFHDFQGLVPVTEKAFHGACVRGCCVVWCGALSSTLFFQLYNPINPSTPFILSASPSPPRPEPYFIFFIIMYKQRARCSSIHQSGLLRLRATKASPMQTQNMEKRMRTFFHRSCFILVFVCVFVFFGLVISWVGGGDEAAAGVTRDHDQTPTREGKKEGRKKHGRTS